MRIPTFAAFTLTLGLAACGGNGGGSSAATDSIPDAEALTLEITGAASEASAPSALAAVLPEAADVSWPSTGDDLTAAQARIAALNSGIRSIFEHVAAVAVASGAPNPGHGTLYGPADRCTVAESPCPDGATATFRLWVGNAVGRGGAFVLQAKPVGAADDAFASVAAGWMRRGAHVRRGAGQVWVNLDHLRAAASAFPGQGKLYGGFAAGPVAKAATYALVGFTPDPAAWAASTVYFRGIRTAAGTARVRVATVKDLVTSGSDTELGLAHVVYNPDLGGRAFALVGNYTWDSVTHGDVPAGSYYFGRACYAPHAPAAPAFKQWFLCPLEQGPAACAADDANPRTVLTGTSWASDCPVAGDPAEYAAPTSAPGADPAAAPSALPGEAGLDVTAEEPPTSDGDAPSVS
jgi:hypothetical protein